MMLYLNAMRSDSGSSQTTSARYLKLQDAKITCYIFCLNKNLKLLREDMVIPSSHWLLHPIIRQHVRNSERCGEAKVSYGVFCIALTYLQLLHQLTPVFGHLMLPVTALQQDHVILLCPSLQSSGDVLHALFEDALGSADGSSWWQHVVESTCATFTTMILIPKAFMIFNKKEKERMGGGADGNEEFEYRNALQKIRSFLLPWVHKKP